MHGPARVMRSFALLKIGGEGEAALCVCVQACAVEQRCPLCCALLKHPYSHQQQQKQRLCLDCCRRWCWLEESHTVVAAVLHWKFAQTGSG